MSIRDRSGVKNPTPSLRAPLCTVPCAHGRRRCLGFGIFEIVSRVGVRRVWSRGRTFASTGALALCVLSFGCTCAPEKKQPEPTGGTKEPAQESKQGAPDLSQKEETVNVVVKTSKGEISIELNREKAPRTVENFLEYLEAGHFSGTIFHRVIPGFMVQGGGFDASMAQKPTRKPIRIESSNGLKNERGTIAMARTNVPDSATSQFFINLIDNDFLNYVSADKPGYTVFGKVTSGMDVVDEIAKVRTGNQGMHADVPLEAVVIESVTVADKP